MASSYNSTVTVVTANQLSPTSVLLLIRRQGSPGDPVLPLLALSVSPQDRIGPPEIH
jgi:hypothetical protein